MRSADWTPTIQPPAGGSRAIYGVAVAWFVARQLAWWLGRGADGVLDWAERSRQRRQLAELDDYMLRDLGLTRADVASETDKPFWRQ